MFIDERQVSPGHHDNVENVAVSGKTMWRHCTHAGFYNPVVCLTGVRDVHMGGARFVFMDGHARTFEFHRFEDWWYVTGGSNLNAIHQSPANDGSNDYTYSSVLNNLSSLAKALW